MCVMVGIHVCVLGGCSCMCVRMGIRVCALGWAFIYVS
jgi:hypothetical protein